MPVFVISFTLASSCVLFPVLVIVVTLRPHPPPSSRFGLLFCLLWSCVFLSRRCACLLQSSCPPWACHPLRCSPSHRFLRSCRPHRNRWISVSRALSVFSLDLNVQSTAIDSPRAFTCLVSTPRTSGAAQTVLSFYCRRHRSIFFS